MQLDSHYSIDFVPKSLTRRKSRFLFIIETARAFTLVGETRWPAPQSETVIGAKEKVDPEKCKKKIFAPRLIMGVKMPHMKAQGYLLRSDLLFLVDPFVKPDSHELGVRNTFLAGKAFYQRDIKWVQTKGNWLTGRTWNLKSLCRIQQFLNLLGTLSSNGYVPFLGFFLEVIPYFFWESAHFFILLK
jgi:hypothetical protein